jgi:hypothetical protein
LSLVYSYNKHSVIRNAGISQPQLSGETNDQTSIECDPLATFSAQKILNIDDFTASIPSCL